jgi:hypothetical protein
MPSQFQPYYPIALQRVQPTAATPATSVSGQGAGSSINKLLQAIAAQKQNAAAQALSNQPLDNLGTLGDEGLINQILPGSYLNA